MWEVLGFSKTYVYIGNNRLAIENLLEKYRLQGPDLKLLSTCAWYQIAVVLGFIINCNGSSVSSLL